MGSINYSKQDPNSQENANQEQSNLDLEANKFTPDKSKVQVEIETKQLELKQQWDLKRLELEQQKEIEENKLKVERLKAWSIAVPIVLALLTIGFNSYNEYQKARLDFEIKAADIITRFQDPGEMKGRARILRTLFSDRLPADFGEKFDEQRFSVPIPSDEKLLLRLIVEHNDQKQEIIKMWKQIYPTETWVDNLK